MLTHPLSLVQHLLEAHPSVVLAKKNIAALYFCGLSCSPSLYKTAADTNRGLFLRHRDQNVTRRFGYQLLEAIFRHSVAVSLQHWVVGSILLQNKIVSSCQYLNSECH